MFRVIVFSWICFVKRRMKRRISVLFFFIPKEGEPRNGTLRKAGRAAPLLCDRSCPNVAKTGNETGDDSEILLEICCVQLYFWKVNPRCLNLIKIWCTTRQSWALSISNHFWILLNLTRNHFWTIKPSFTIRARIRLSNTKQRTIPSIIFTLIFSFLNHFEIIE